MADESNRDYDIGYGKPPLHSQFGKGHSGNPRGRPFAKGESGNPAGKPKGARHRVTLATETLLDGEAEGLTRKAIEMGPRWRRRRASPVPGAHIADTSREARAISAATISIGCRHDRRNH